MLSYSNLISLLDSTGFLCQAVVAVVVVVVFVVLLSS